MIGVESGEAGKRKIEGLTVHVIQVRGLGVRGLGVIQVRGLGVRGLGVWGLRLVGKRRVWGWGLGVEGVRVSGMRGLRGQLWYDIRMMFITET